MMSDDKHDEYLIKEFPDRNSLADHLTGMLLTELGRGVKIHSIVSQIILQTMSWSEAYKRIQSRKEHE